MFRIYGEDSSSSLTRVGSMPSAPGPSQREMFGLVGIYNRTHSCFMNVILEVLASLRGISYEILGITRPGVWLNGVQHVLNDLLTKDNPCTVEGRGLPVEGQHDAHEFYMKIRREGLNATAGTQEALRWNNLIVGTSFTIISRPTGEFYRATKNEFAEIGIPIGRPGIVTLSNALDGLYQGQQFTDDNYVIDGSRTKAPFRTRLVHLPDVLMVRLNRIDFRNNTVKLNDYMSFPPGIDFNNYMLTSEEASKFAIEEPVDKDTRFTLHAVVVHSGRAQTGHYYLHIRNPRNYTEWLTIDSERVEPALTSSVFRDTTGGTSMDGRAKSVNAYLLFYIRTSAIERVINGTGSMPMLVPLPQSSSSSSPSSSSSSSSSFGPGSSSSLMYSSSSSSSSSSTGTSLVPEYHQGLNTSPLDSYFGGSVGPRSDLIVYIATAKEHLNVHINARGEIAECTGLAVAFKQGAKLNELLGTAPKDRFLVRTRIVDGCLVFGNPIDMEVDGDTLIHNYFVGIAPVVLAVPKEDDNYKDLYFFPVHRFASGPYLDFGKR